jgi:hypothetical protein
MYTMQHYSPIKLGKILSSEAKWRTLCAVKYVSHRETHTTYFNSFLEASEIDNTKIEGRVEIIRG